MADKPADQLVPKPPTKPKGSSRMPSRREYRPARGSGRTMKRWVEALKTRLRVIRLSPEHRSLLAYFTHPIADRNHD